MSVHSSVWRVEVRAESLDPGVPGGGRLLGYAQRQADGRWHVQTRDGRRTAVGTRVEAVLALTAMCDTAAAGDDPEGGGHGGA